MRKHVLSYVLHGALIAGAAGIILSAEAPTVVYKSSKELTGVLLEKAKATPVPQMMDAPVVRADRYQINVVRRTTPQGAIAHDVGTEIHSIIDGSATLVTGGTLIRPAGGRGGGGTIENGQTRRVSKGDIVMVPPQTPHWYKDIEGTVTYLEIRFDVGAAPGGPATLLTDAEAAKVLATRGAAAPAPLMFAAPVGKGDRFQANIVRRTKPQGGGAHELGTEVHHILSGSGTLVTGGTVVKSAGANSVSTIQGGESHHVSPGDVVLVPAGTPHWYKDVDGTITYLEVRFEVGTK